MISSENIYLLGAGFSKAVYPKIPLNNDLLGSIIDNGGTKISAYQKKYKTEDIEMLLTQIDLDSFNDEQIRKDRQVIESEISAFFSNCCFFSSLVSTSLSTSFSTLLKLKSILSSSFLFSIFHPYF